MDAVAELQPRHTVASDGAEAGVDERTLFHAFSKVRLVEADGDGAAVEAVALQLVLLAVAVRPDGVVDARAAFRVDGFANVGVLRGLG